MSESSRKIKERFFENLKAISVKKKEKFTKGQELNYAFIGFGIGILLFIGLLVFMEFAE
jgi:hypothetical protein